VAAAAAVAVWRRGSMWVLRLAGGRSWGRMAATALRPPPLPPRLLSAPSRLALPAAAARGAAATATPATAGGAPRLRLLAAPSDPLPRRAAAGGAPLPLGKGRTGPATTVSPKMRTRATEVGLRRFSRRPPSRPSACFFPQPEEAATPMVAMGAVVAVAWAGSRSSNHHSSCGNSKRNSNRNSNRRRGLLPPCLFLDSCPLLDSAVCHHRRRLLPLLLLLLLQASLLISETSFRPLR